jgi:hypothetical protein
MVNDAYFGLISQKARKQNVYVPTEYIDVIRNTSRNIDTWWMSQKFFLNFSDFFSSSFHLCSFPDFSSLVLTMYDKYYSEVSASYRVRRIGRYSRYCRFPVRVFCFSCFDDNVSWSSAVAFGYAFQLHSLAIILTILATFEQI